MQLHEILVDAYSRIRTAVHGAVEGLDRDALAFRPDAEANSIAWLVWHLTRVQDDHVAEIAGREQTWTADGWNRSFALPFDPADTGFGHTPEQVAAVQPDSHELLLGYHDAVAERTLAYLSTVDAAELDRIIDRSWDPPVSVGTRLVSVIGDDLQHVGQARYLQGLWQRR